MTDMTMGQRIAECRKQSGLSQEALGERMGVSRQAISKWESDGAVPEIDKLIALSKLFGVSVGWLLGVEEMPEAAEQQPEISEELLRKIEEIVLRYRPRKEKLSRNKKVMIGALAALVIGFGCVFFTEWGIISNTVSYMSAQVRNNNEQNAMIMDQLSELENRMDGVNAQPQGFALSEYRFDIEPHEQDPTAIISFSAFPTSWHADNKAYISVRFDDGGEQVLTQYCAWDGAGLIAAFRVKIVDGYAYWLVVEYPDGTQEQTKLTDEYAEMLETNFSIEIAANRGSGHFDAETGALELKDYEVTVTRPYLMDVCRNLVAWKAVELQLYHTGQNGRELIASHPLFDPTTHEGDEYRRDNERAQIHSMTFPCREPFAIPELETGDSLDLWVRVEMSNGQVTAKQLDSWTYDGDGDFRNVWGG